MFIYRRGNIITSIEAEFSFTAVVIVYPSIYMAAFFAAAVELSQLPQLPPQQPKLPQPHPEPSAEAVAKIR